MSINVDANTRKKNWSNMSINVDAKKKKNVRSSLSAIVLIS